MNKKIKFRVNVVNGPGSAAQVVLVEGDEFSLIDNGVLTISLGGRPQAVFAPGFWALMTPLYDTEVAA